MKKKTMCLEKIYAMVFENKTICIMTMRWDSDYNFYILAYIVEIKRSSGGRRVYK